MTSISLAAEQMRLSSDGRALLRADMTPRGAVAVLRDAGLAQDALQLLARLLPRRYAVAWLCQCAGAEAIDAHDPQGVALAEAWSRQPDEARRRAALQFADRAGYASAGAWVAAAAAWSAGSLTDADQAPAPVPGQLAACAWSAAVNHLAALDPARFLERRDAFTVQAMALLPDAAEGGAA